MPSNKTTTTSHEPVDRWAKVVTAFGFVLVLICTLFPFDFSLEYIFNKLQRSGDSADIIANIGLFIPFGFGFASLLGKAGSRERRIRGLVVLAASAALSIAVEALQMLLPSRTPTLTDIVTNSLGGFLGFVGFQLWGIKIFSYISAIAKQVKQRLSIKSLTAALIAYVLLACLISSPWPGATSFSNWNPDFPLLIGNEKTGFRSWQGYISEVAIAHLAIAPKDVEQAFSEQNSFTNLGDSLVAFYQFKGEGRYSDKTGNLPDLSWRGKPDVQNKTGLTLTSSSWLETSSAASMTKKLRETSQFTIFTGIATANAAQFGPARIISLSDGYSDRNFTLGQQGSDLIFRLRTPVTGQNGTKPELLIPGIFADSNFHRLVITYSAPVLQIYVDGIQNLHSFELTPDVTIFRYLSGASALDSKGTNRYKIMYYAIIFFPLGLLLGAINRIVKGNFLFYVLLLCGGILLPSLMVEAIFATSIGRALELGNVILGIAIAASGMLLVALQAKLRVLSRAEKGL